MDIIANGVRLHVEDRGQGPTTLVFLHYWGGSSRTWREVIGALGPDVRSIAIDQRGWGRSDAPADGYALADLADDAEAVIAALSLDRYILVGHSMGGKVAQLIASRRPAGLQGLVLVAPSPPTPMAVPLEVRQGMVHAYDDRTSVIATVEQVLAGGLLEPDLLERVITDSLAGARPAKTAWPLAISQEDISQAVVAIDAPTLIISGTDDRVDPPAVLRAELLPRVPQARLHLLPGIGHLSPLEAPADLAAAIRAFTGMIDRSEA
jgi:pimeloyl-ACP methyl ester carboxylesterase